MSICVRAFFLDTSILTWCQHIHKDRKMRKILQHEILLVLTATMDQFRVKAETKLKQK